MNQSVSNKDIFGKLCFIFFVSIWGFGLLPTKTALLILPIAGWCYFRLWGKRDIFRKYIVLFLLFLFVSTFSCWFYRKQPVTETMMTTEFINYSLIVSYFIYAVLKPSVKAIEKAILLFYIFFIIVYALLYMTYPMKIVPILAGEYTHRFRIVGQAINSLGFLLCLNNWMVTKKWKYMLLLFPGMLVFFILSFRMMMAGIIAVSILMYIKILKVNTKSITNVLALTILLAISLLSIPFVNTSIDRMLEVNKTENYYDDDYIRWLQFEYFTTDFFKSDTEWLTGAGQPGTSSQYGKEMTVDILNQKSAIETGWVDWGLLGLSWIIGPITVIILILIMLKSIYISWRSGNNYIYISCWFLFLLLISINNAEAHRQGTFGIYSVVIYLVARLDNPIKNKHTSTLQDSEINYQN